ncbi:MAG: hypothetical protein HYY06_26615 [Deltaproteobacteria bacterium]|nr:hypothetical protein [Deltaproteobacteria bacterium]
MAGWWTRRSIAAAVECGFLMMRSHWLNTGRDDHRAPRVVAALRAATHDVRYIRGGDRAMEEREVAGLAVAGARVLVTAEPSGARFRPILGAR